MKITLLTTLSELEENKRIKEEVVNMGHEFELLDEKNFEFRIKDNQFYSKGLTDIKTDILIVRGIFNSIKSISAVVASVQQRGIKVFDNNLIKHQYSIDKVVDMVKLSLNGIPTPNTVYSRDFEKWNDAASQLNFPVVIKSTRMGKGANVFKISSKEELDNLVESFVTEEKDAKSYLLQEFIPYEIDLRVLIIGEDVFAMRRIPKEGEFRANFSLGGSVELFDIDEDTKKLAIDALRAVEMSVGGVDVLISKDKKCILEVNHTAGFLGMEKATGKNITKMYIEHAIKHAK